MAHEWRSGALGDFIELKRGYDLPSQDRSDGRVPVVSSSGPSGWHSQSKVQAPGVVTGRYGTLGQVFFVREDFWPLNTTLYVRDFKGNDPRFISYFLRTVDFFSCSDKAAVPGVNRNHLHQTSARLPPLDEQRRIAGVLGALDDKIELNRKMNETLEQMAQAIFKSWFIDFDGHTEFEDSELGRIPKGWRVTRLGDHVELQRGTTYKSQLLELPGPVLLGLASIERNGGFRRGRLKTYGGDCPGKLMVKAGELFVSLKDVTQAGDLLGSVARLPPDVGEGRLTQDTVKLIPLPACAPLSFLYRGMLTHNYREYCRARGQGTTNLSLSREDFLHFGLPTPPLPELAKFDELESAIATRVHANEAESETLAALRDTLLPKLISGELRIPEAEELASSPAQLELPQSS